MSKNISIEMGELLCEAKNSEAAAGSEPPVVAQLYDRLYGSAASWQQAPENGFEINFGSNRKMLVQVLGAIGLTAAPDQQTRHIEHATVIEQRNGIQQAKKSIARDRLLQTDLSLLDSMVQVAESAYQEHGLDEDTPELIEGFVNFPTTDITTTVVIAGTRDNSSHIPQVDDDRPGIVVGFRTGLVDHYIHAGGERRNVVGRLEEPYQATDVSDLASEYFLAIGSLERNVYGQYDSVSADRVFRVYNGQVC